MTESTARTLYVEKMKEHIDQLRIEEVNQLEGVDLTPAREFKTGWTRGSFSAYRADKVSKIGIGSLTMEEDAHRGFCTIFPDRDYVLPIFISLWEEREEKVSFLVDIMPTVDSLMDEEFRLRYIESVQPLWDKYLNLPGICPEEDDEVRSLCSIIYTAAKVPIEKEGMRLAALAPHTEYLKSYLAFLPEAQPATHEAKRKEVIRKTAAIRGTLWKGFAERLKAPMGQEMEQNLREAVLAILL